MAAYWTRKDDGSKELETIAPWQEAEQHGDKPLPVLPPFKNVVFDLGGVLVDLKTAEAGRLFAELGLPMPVAFSTAKPLNGMPTAEPGPAGDFIRLVHAMDTGELTGEKFIDIILSQCRPGVTRQQVSDAYNSAIVFPRQRLELLQRLRRDYKVYLLSNIGDMHWATTVESARRQGFDIEECFDQMFLSYQLRMAKPDPAIFQHLIKTTGINPAETLYIDDFHENIAAGQQAGLIAFQIEGNSLERYLPHLFPHLQE